MYSYDDDLPTQQEEILLNELVNHNESQQQRIAILIQLQNFIIGSERSKIAFFHVGTLEILHNLLQEYSSSIHFEILIEILDCISSFAKSSHKNLLNHLVELGFIQQIFILLSFSIDSVRFYESCLRCLRSFFLPNLSPNIFIPIPFVLLSDVNKSERSVISAPSDNYRSTDNHFPVNILFDDDQSLDRFRHLLSISKSTPISILEILSCLCSDNERQKQIVDKDFIPSVMQLLAQNSYDPHKSHLASVGNEHLIGVCLKFFCSISYENPTIAERLHDTFCSETNQTLCEIISNLLTKVHRSVLISYYASKCFVHLCKTKVLLPSDPYVSLQSLTTLIHLCTNSVRNKSVTLYVECVNTLVYLLDGNTSLHHTAMHTEQLLSQLFICVFTPSKLLNEKNDEAVVIKIRSSTFTLLAVLASHHADIQKRIAEQENLISTAIECYRSTHRCLQIAALRLFHGLSRSVDQLRTTFNDTICDILLDALKSSDLSLVKTSSSVISNSVLEFSTCRMKLINGGILNLLLTMLSHPDQELAINSIWALRNLSYLSTLETKQDIIQGLTIERIYSLLEQCTDQKFLLCLLSLLRNLFHEKHMDTLLPLFNSTKLQSTLQQMVEKSYPEKIHCELQLLIDHINSTDNAFQQRSSAESVNSTCRTFLCPEYACDEMDQLDCS